MSLRPWLGFCPGGWCHSHFSYEKSSWRAQIIYPGPQVAYLHKGVSSSDLPGSKILILGFSILEVCWSLLSCTIAVWDSKPCLVTSPLPQKSPRISNNNTMDLQSVYWAEHRGCCQSFKQFCFFAFSFPRSPSPALLILSSSVLSSSMHIMISRVTIVSRMHICLSVSCTGLCVSHSLEGSIPVLCLFVISALSRYSSNHLWIETFWGNE